MTIEDKKVKKNTIKIKKNKKNPKLKNNIKLVEKKEIKSLNVQSKKDNKVATWIKPKKLDQSSEGDLQVDWNKLVGTILQKETEMALPMLTKKIFDLISTKKSIKRPNSVKNMICKKLKKNKRFTIENNMVKHIKNISVTDVKKIAVKVNNISKKKKITKAKPGNKTEVKAQ